MKRAILQLTAQILVEICKPNPHPRYYDVTENAVPEDAKAVGGRYNSLLDIFELAVESDAFADVSEADPLPVLPSPVFSEHWMP